MRDIKILVDCYLAGKNRNTMVAFESDKFDDK
jgi:hypothetical protein